MTESRKYSNIIFYTTSKFVHSGRSGLSHSRPTRRSVLHRLIFLEMTSGLSRRLMRVLSFSALLDILFVPVRVVVADIKKNHMYVVKKLRAKMQGIPSCRDITRAPSFTIKAVGSLKVFRPRLQNWSLNLREISLVSSKCCL